MPVQTVMNSQLNALETGLNRIRRSKLMTAQGMKDMYGAIDRHHRDVKLAHLTGKTKDILEKGRQDTKFYYILIQMLTEVLRSSDGEEKDNLKQVLLWYEGNKHTLANGPRFGHKKSLPKPQFKDNFEQIVQQMDQSADSLVPEDPNSPCIRHEESNYCNNSMKNTEVDEKHVKKKQASQSKSRSQKHKTDKDDPLLPKRKVQPLSHLYNPHARSYSATGPNEVNPSEVHSPVKLHIHTEDRPGISSAGSDKANNLRQWNSFYQDQNYGQEVLGKLQHLGRTGLASGLRYVAHDQGLHAEDFTKDVIFNYARMGTQSHVEEGGDTLLTRPQTQQPVPFKKPLEEFYELAENYYPHKLPKYPSFDQTRCQSRAKSAPTTRHRTLGSARSEGARSGRKIVADTKSEEGRETPDDDRSESEMRLETVVNLINSITDEMTYYKEKLTPDPSPGFRQPMMQVDPQDRPMTAPAGTVGRPSSPEERDPPSTKSAIIEAIDWRGKVAPDTQRYRWSATPFVGHTQVKPTPQTPPSPLHSSLRSAGSTQGGNRPRTAPIPPKEKWNTEKPSDDNQRASGQAASHTTMEVDATTVDHMVQVHHIDSKRKHGSHSSLDELDDYDFLLEGFKDSRPTTTDTGPMEFMSIIAPKSITGTGSRSTSVAQSGRVSGMSPHPPLTPSLTIPSGALHHLPDTDSLGGDIDVPNMHDLDDDLEQLSACQSWEQDQEDIKEQNIECGQQPVTNPQKEVKFERSPERVGNVVADSRQLLGEIEQLIGPNCTRTSAPKPSKKENETSYSKPSYTDSNYDVSAFHSSEDPKFLVDKLEEIDNVSRNQRDAGKCTGIQFKHSSSRSHNWNSSPDLDLENYEEVNHYIDNKVQRAVSCLPSSPRQPKPKVLGRAFPKQEPPSEREIALLEVKGRGGRKMRVRSAGTVPARAKSVHRSQMIQRQQEMLHKSQASAYRTAPSIPTPFNPHGSRSPRNGAAYSTEHEAMAHRTNSPRHYLQRVGHLRSDNELLPSLNDPNHGEMRPLTSSLRVVRFRPGSHRHSPSPVDLGPGYPGTPVDMDSDRQTGSVTDYMGHIGSPNVPVPSDISGSSDDTQRRYLEIGRPIADYLEHVDPDSYDVAVQRQKEAHAAVDIQRIFRGYVARNNYKYLQNEERERRENQQMAAIEIQRAYRKHMHQKKAIARRTPSSETLEWARGYRQRLQQKAQQRETKSQAIIASHAKNKATADTKIAEIGPHVDVYVPFHPPKEVVDTALLNRAANIIQRFVRGYLVRIKVERLKRKAKQHGVSWTRFVSQYKDLVRRIQQRMGIEKPVIEFSYTVIDEYMDVKKRYESVFDRKAFGSELDPDELGTYFKECDLYPAAAEVDEAMDAVYRGRARGKNIIKQDMMEITFFIYPPRGSGIPSRRRSTWLNPIIDGEEAVKMLGSENVESVDFKTCWKIVSDSHKQRSQVSQEEEKRQREEEWEKKHGNQRPETQNETLKQKEEKRALNEQPES